MGIEGEKFAISRDCLIDLDKQTVQRRGLVYRLSYTQFRILEILLAHLNCPVSTDEIIRYTSNMQATITLGTLYVYVYRLRARIEEDPRHPKLLLCIGDRRYMMHNVQHR